MSAKGIFLPVLFLLMFFPRTVFASVAGDVNQANRLYKQGRFDDALDLYQKALEKDDSSPVVRYDLGADFYKKGDYAKALEYWRQSSQEKNLKIRSKAQYNLGNALYKSGVQKETADVNGAIKTLQESLGQYEQVIKDNSKDQDAVFNEGVVKKEIERLKHQQKQQQQNQKQDRSQQKRQNQQQNQQNKTQKQDQNQRQSSLQNARPKSGGQEKQSKTQQNQQSQVQESPRELDRQQADNMLEDYRENEEPKKLLNYMPQKIDTRPVLKDW